MDEDEENIEKCDDKLIWDYRTGDIICRNSGLVVGKIYDYEPAEEEKGFFKGEKKEIGKISFKAPRSYILYRKLQRKMRKRKLSLNEEMFKQYMRTGKQLMVLSFPGFSEEEILGRDESLRGLYEEIKRDPRFSGRTARAKIAIAMMVKGYENREISALTGLSSSHIARLKKLYRGKRKHSFETRGLWQ